MARILIVGCGCRGREVGAELAAAGHAVRGTSRSEEGVEAIENAGFEGVAADPDRLGTLLPALEGVSVVVWLLGRVPAAELHGPRLESFLEKLVDTPVRGFVYEPGGGEELVETAALRSRIPVEIAAGDGLVRAVETLLS